MTDGFWEDRIDPERVDNLRRLLDGNEESTEVFEAQINHDYPCKPFIAPRAISATEPYKSTGGAR